MTSHLIDSRTGRSTRFRPTNLRLLIPETCCERYVSVLALVIRVDKTESPLTNLFQPDIVSLTHVLDSTSRHFHAEPRPLY